MIRLYRAGIFYVAYEQSCYAFHKYIRQFKVKKKLVKKISSEIVSLGFPVSSEEKLLIGRTVAPFESGIAVRLNAYETIDNDEFLTWKTAMAIP